MAGIAEMTRHIQLINIINSIPDDVLDKAEAAYEEIAKLAPNDQSAMNRAIAEHNGVTVEKLVLSPNMQQLAANYYLYLVEESVKILVGIGMTDEQARAMIEYDLKVER